MPIALVAMGDAGIPSRVLASWFGSCWTYAGDGAAPGQISAQRMTDEFGFRRIGSRTAIYGVLGRPVSHSVSPAMHNAAFRAARVDAVYLPLAAADFDDFLAFADAVNLAGASVTAPFKVAAFERADECDPVSRRIQSVNTLRRSGTKWLGSNTDVNGFLTPLQSDDALARQARHRARRGRRRAIGRRRAAVGRRARHDRGTTRRPGANGGGVERRQGRHVAACARQLGSARQRHAGWHRAQQSMHRRCPTATSLTACSCTTWFTTRPTRAC